MTTPETLPKVYAPAQFEPQVSARWEASNCFHADPRQTSEEGKPPYCILIPPPNVTAALHLGHALNNTLQDILTRYHRMRGFNTLWMPGTDHAGIATQAVVEKRLIQDGKRRTDFTRDEFIALVQAWKDEYETTITAQLKAMGCSCDWPRQRFTMDPVCAKAVREAFFRLFKMGLIYRGKRLVNWDPETQTALADDEVEMEEVQGKMYYLRYPIVSDPLAPGSAGGPPRKVHPSQFDPPAEPGANGAKVNERRFLTVATTRPETMLGDVAVAMNPKDARAKDFVGKKVRLPIVGCVIPIIADDYVVLPRAMGGDGKDPKSEIATGFLKVTPGHDVNDYEIGRRHNLSVINVLAPDASISKDHGWLDWAECDQTAIHPLLGLSRDLARERVVAWFKDHNLLEDVRDYAHSVGHSYRSHVPIEPYLSDQWYVKVTDDRMSGEALRAMREEQFEGEKPAREATPPLAPGSAGGSSRKVGASHFTPPAEPTNHPPAEPGAKGGDGSLTFFPARYARTFQSWHTPGNLRDWCISRQLWWGHRIPVWSWRTVGRNEELVRPMFEDRPGSGTATISRRLKDYEAQGRIAVIESRQTHLEDERYTEGDVEIAVRSSDDYEVIQFLEEKKFHQDPDVLDTWFSSGLWPLSTMGWPEPEAFPQEIPEGSDLLRAFNPSSVLCTSREIITLWVSRMVMFNRCLTADDPEPARRNRLPFTRVYIHPMIQDGHGQKMSKSLGNGVDPRDIITTHGADALRFTLAQLATATQDVRMPVDMICPHPGCGETFHPVEITASSGHRVAAPAQTCPKCKRKMATVIGITSGKARVTPETPLALNTSSRFDFGRNFCNKFWNAARFALTNLSATLDTQTKAHGSESVGVDRLSISDLPLPEKWILARLHRTLHKIEDSLEEYQFNIYAEAMYDFIWRDFCDWYLEAIKPTVKTNPAQQQVLRTVLNASLRLLHPICPFITESLYPSVAAPGSSGEAGLEHFILGPSDLLATAPWPDIACAIDDTQSHDQFARMQMLVESIRTLRGEHRIPDRKRITLHASPTALELIKSSQGVVESLAGLDSVQPLQTPPPRAAVPFNFEGEEHQLLGLVEEVDPGVERERLAADTEKLAKVIENLRGRLANPGYVQKAPPDKVQETRDLLEQTAREFELKKERLASLSR